MTPVVVGRRPLSPERRQKLLDNLVKARAAKRGSAPEAKAEEKDMAVRPMGSPDQPIRPEFQGEYEGFVEDRVVRWRRERAAVPDTRDEFRSAEVKIFFGPDKKAMPIRVRYTKDGTFAFAVYSENQPWHDQPEQDWFSAARSGLMKFAAERGLSVIDGPKPETLAQYNMTIQTQEPMS